MIAVPRLATAATVVADPTGDADSAFLAELKASLETVAAEAPAKLDADLRSRATVTDAGVELVVELVPNDGSEPVRETRIVSKASALSQARAMARAAIESFTAPAGVATTTPKVVVVQEKSAAPQSAPLPQKYDRRKALRMTVLPTVLLPVAGGVLISLFTVCMPLSVGIVVAGIGVAFGPATGYFWMGRWQHALGMIGLRTLTLGLGATFMGLYIVSLGGDSSSDMECEDDIENDIPACKADKPHTGLLVASIISLTASLVVAIVDAALVGRGADRANAEWRERNKPTVQVTPVAWTDGNGQRTYGLALSGSF
jgi:hypothetical protein